MAHDAKTPEAANGPARRDFLKAMTGAASVAVAAVAAEPAEAQPAAEREGRDERTKARYQANSPDVQAYYRTNRY
jgi:hypothetical protein